MNKVDKVYIDLLNDIMERGKEKNTRAGKVLSVFGRQLRFDLKEGFPLLTTKKVFMKGITHELLWFLQRPFNSHGSMNIYYLNMYNVHIWDDDAYRWFKEWIDKHIVKPVNMNYEFVVCINDDEIEKKPVLEHWIYNEARKNDLEWLINMSKEEFLDLVYQKVEIRVYTGMLYDTYRFGDLGPIYGKQWRSFGAALNTYHGIDQIKNIIDTLRVNPNDRRMLCIAFNPAVIDQMALPPCHVMMQFYTRPLERHERWNWLREATSGDSDEDWFDASDEKMDSLGVPKYGLSCMWTQRSVDVCCGLPFNIASYALLTHMIAHIVGMIPDELVGSLGDCHIYKNHIDGVNEQLTREGCDILPKLIIKRNVESIEDFRYDDFEIKGYNPDPPIKYQLNVG
jgi:thymidylate synthase